MRRVTIAQFKTLAETTKLFAAMVKEMVDEITSVTVWPWPMDEYIEIRRDKWFPHLEKIVDTLEDIIVSIDSLLKEEEQKNLTSQIKSKNRRNACD